MSDIPQSILDAVCVATRINPDQLFTKRRFKEIVLARHITMFLLYTDLEWTYRRIASAFNVDTTTACANVEAAKQLLFTSDTARRQLKLIRSIIEGDG